MMSSIWVVHGPGEVARVPSAGQFVLSYEFSSACSGSLCHYAGHLSSSMSFLQFVVVPSATTRGICPLLGGHSAGYYFSRSVRRSSAGRGSPPPLSRPPMNTVHQWYEYTQLTILYLYIHNIFTGPFFSGLKYIIGCLLATIDTMTRI